MAIISAIPSAMLDNRRQVHKRIRVDHTVTFLRSGPHAEKCGVVATEYIRYRQARYIDFIDVVAVNPIPDASVEQRV